MWKYTCFKPDLHFWQVISLKISMLQHLLSCPWRAVVCCMKQQVIPFLCASIYICSIFWDRKRLFLSMLRLSKEYTLLTKISVIVILRNFMKNCKFQLFVDLSHLCFDLLLLRFRFSLLTLIKFSIHSRLSNFNPGWNNSVRIETFHIIAIIFNSVYWVEISTRDENLHVISPLIIN